MLRPEDAKFLDTLKKTHFFILDSIKIYNKLATVKVLYMTYKGMFKDDALDLDIFKECHETIRQCLDVALSSSS